MVDKIYDVKAKIIEHMEKVVAADRMDVAEMEKLADMVKDLSEAEEKCWEAEYYKSVTRAMAERPSGYDGGYDNMGYDPMGHDRMAPFGYDDPSVGRNGYRGRDSMGRYVSRRG